MHRKPLSTLSGGFKLRVLLAQVLAGAPDVLLLDEPTNHLDVPTLTWFDEFLRRSNKALILISHDKDFLNRQINRVVSLELEGVREYAGNYDDYMLASTQARERISSSNAKAKERVAELQDFVRRFAANKSKARQATSRAKQIEKIKVEDIKPEDWDRCIAVDLNGMFYCTRKAMPLIKAAGGGSIINISSVSGVRPSPGTAAYGAAKAGVDALTRSLAQEWGPQVRVNSIVVGLVRTPDTADHYGGDETVAAIERTIPAGRMADVAEIGRVTAFLASDLSSYVSGAEIACHGGGETPVFLHIAQNAQNVQHPPTHEQGEPK